MYIVYVSINLFVFVINTQTENSYTTAFFYPRQCGLGFRAARLPEPDTSILKEATKRIHEALVGSYTPTEPKLRMGASEG